MFTLEAKKYILSFAVASSLMAAGAFAKVEKSVDGAIKYPVKNGKYTAYRVNTQKVGSIHYGRKPTKKEINAWNIDILPDGTGLPEGKGSVEEGSDLYDSKCAMCHGDMGTGGKGYPTLVGGEGSLKNQLVHPENGDEPPIKTIGSYWPYASTLFWYIKSAMPFNHPTSLSNNQVYALTAYLLSLNDIAIDGQDLDDDYVLDKKKFLKIKMPNVNGFYPNVDAKNGPEIMKKFLSNPKNYGTGTRCMHDCPRAKVVHIKQELHDFHPVLSEVRDLPKPKKEKGVKSEAQKMYEATCKACHGNPVVGAPVVGDKKAWAEVIKKGMGNVYQNAINGKNGMPPKGGNPSLSNDQIKEIVDYMVKESK